uniref:Uncharacterized protein n=1 Tax=Timema shepardi TaxID=629360 RepID=A0A7R9G5B7_TIMSH|nr:unnamed protein product [Timema shepardi]
MAQARIGKHYNKDRHPIPYKCEDEWSEVQERFKKEGLDFDVLGSEERLLHVWRWLVDAESNLHSSRRQLDKLRDLRSEEMESCTETFGLSVDDHRSEHGSSQFIIGYHCFELPNESAPVAIP